MKLKSRLWLAVLLMLQAVLAFNCEQTAPSTLEPSTNDVSISITPSTAVVAPAQRLQFSAQVTGVSPGNVAWGILNPSATKGTVDSNGLYIAPNTAPATSITIVAQIIGHPAKTAMATVWFQGPGTVSATSNPLVAQYSIVVPDGGKVRIEFGPDTSYGLHTWSQPGGGPVSVLVAGMKASSTYHMRADIELPDGTQLQDIDHTFQTGPLPAGRIPQITVKTPGTLTPNPGVELLNLITPGGLPTDPLTALVTDLQGNVIWYYDLDPTGTNTLAQFPFKFMPNGHVLVNAAPIQANGTALPGVLREIDLAGNTIREMSITYLNTRLAAAGVSLVVNSIHHDFCLLPNGHVILLAGLTKDFTDLPGYPGTTSVLGDALVDIDQNWNPVWIW